MLDQLNPSKLEQLLPLLTEYGTKVLGAILLFAVAAYISGYLRKLTVAALEKGRVEPTLTKFAGTMVKWAVLTVAVISILGMFGVQTASFAALIAAMGLAIGLAFQGTLANFAAGVMLLIFRPFRVGQVILVAGQTGTVNEISIFTTAIDTPDKRRIILPNSSVFNATIENVSHHPIRRCDVAVGTAYDADLEKTKAVLMAVVKKNDKVLSDPEPVVVLTGLGASSIDWAIRAFVNTEDYWAVKEQIMWDVKYALDDNEIGIPFPQMDIHVVNQQLANDLASKNGNGRAHADEVMQ